MKTSILFFVLLISLSNSSLFAQKLIAKDGHVWFYSKMPMETIEAHNKQVVTILDKASGDLVFSMLIKGFHFERALMEEHFNENYIESSKFPKADFKGKITNLKDVNFAVDGTYKAIVAGAMTIHGVKKDVTESGSIIITGGKVKLNSKFKILVSDYGIKIPSVVGDKIAKQMDITVDVELKASK